MKRFSLIGALLLALTVLPTTVRSQSPGIVNIYSDRHYGALEQPFVAFEEATGIEVRVSSGGTSDILARLTADIERGGRSVADVFLSIDAGALSLAAERGLLQPVESEVLLANIPETQRDPENRWFGLSQRVRTAVYNPENVTQEELDEHLNTYADLADPVWAGRLCMRPASHVYTISLVSSLIYHLGEEEAQAVVSGWVANDPIYINSDTRMIEAVYAGECDVTLVNHYYLARLTDQEAEAAAGVAIKWLNQETTGAFYNVSGAGVVIDAANYDNAVAFIEFISSIDGQAGEPSGFPGSNYEFPTNPEAEINEIIATFGERMLDLEYPLWEYGQLQDPAVALLEQAGYGFDEN